MSKKHQMGYEEVKSLMEATFKIIDSGKAEANGIDINAEIQFLNLFVETLVVRSLTDGKQTLAATRARYGRMKLGIQEAVALGFQQSVLKAAGQNVDYCCVIKGVEERSGVTNH